MAEFFTAAAFNYRKRKVEEKVARYLYSRSKGKDRKKHDRRKSNKDVHCYIRNKNGSKVTEKWKKGGWSFDVKPAQVTSHSTFFSHYFR